MPVFVTVAVADQSPTELYVKGDAVFTNDNDFVCTAVTVSSSGSIDPVHGRLGRVLDRARIEISLRDRVLAVQVIVAPGASPPAGQVTVALSSATVTGPARVTLPVFLTSSCS